MSAAALSTAGEPREQPPIDGGADGEAAADAHAERHSPRKEDGATALGSDGDAARDDRAECSETERERRTACGISHVCGVSSTTQVNEPTSQEQTHKQKQTRLPRRRGRDREFGVSRGKLLQAARIGGRALPCRTGNCQHPVTDDGGKEYATEPPDLRQKSTGRYQPATHK